VQWKTRGAARGEPWSPHRLTNCCPHDQGAVVVLQLADEGRVRLGAPLSPYLPTIVPARRPPTAAEPHQRNPGLLAGSRSWQGAARGPQPAVVDGRGLPSSRARKPQFTAGAGYAYSNTDCILLGRSSWPLSATAGPRRYAGASSTPAPGSHLTHHSGAVRPQPDSHAHCAWTYGPEGLAFESRSRALGGHDGSVDGNLLSCGRTHPAKWRRYRPPLDLYGLPARPFTSADLYDR
jgi:hypothetical protein